MCSTRVVSCAFSESNLERDARARAWAYIFERWREKKEAAGPGGHNDAEDLKNDRTASENYTH